MKIAESHLLFFVIILFMLCEISLQSEEYLFDDSTGYGRVFDGIGAISGGGASSKLLVSYPEQQRNEILDYLFKPNFGANLQILKVEIGSDTESTDGTEATHMRTPDEENYERGYEWWMMNEAKKRNPAIQLYGLPWGFPGWVGGTNRNIYDDPARTALYVAKWINGAKVHYNLTMDYVGIWNEKVYNITYIKTLRKTLDANGLQNTKIIAADDGAAVSWQQLPDEILNDPELAAAVYGIGVHHPGTNSTDKAISLGKPLWASEDYSTFNDQIGGGCWARTLNQNYVNGYMTGTIAWALITSWYYALPYFGHGLMNAFEPWSGHYEVSSPIWVTAHTTQFTEIGWQYLKHGYGVGKLSKGGSYVSLISPDKVYFTIIIETMSYNSSICYNPSSIPWFNVEEQNITVVLNGSMSGIEYIHGYVTQFNSNGQPSYFQYKFPLTVQDRKLNVQLGVDQVVTLTNVATGHKGIYPPSPPSKSFPLPFSEDFERFKEAEEPALFAQQMGAFEVHDVGGSHGRVMRQMTLEQTIPFCWKPELPVAISIIGNTNWTDIAVQADVFIGAEKASDGVFIAARIDRTGCKTSFSQGVFLFFYPDQKLYMLSGTLDKTIILKKGQIESVNKGWNTLNLFVQGSTARGEVNGKTIFTYTSVPKNPNQGFVAVGTGSFGYADFDNVKISNV